MQASIGDRWFCQKRLHLFFKYPKKHLQKDHPLPVPYTPADVIEKVKKTWWRRLFGTSVISDLSDLVCAGLPGESTHILRALMQDGEGLRAYVPHCNEEAVQSQHPSQLSRSLVCREEAGLTKYITKE